MIEEKNQKSLALLKNCSSKILGNISEMFNISFSIEGSYLYTIYNGIRWSDQI